MMKSIGHWLSRCTHPRVNRVFKDIGICRSVLLRVVSLLQQVYPDCFLHVNYIIYSIENHVLVLLNSAILPRIIVNSSLNETLIAPLRIVHLYS